MKTTHHILAGDARQMSAVGDESVELIVTSPPYPMIEMWDSAFTSLNPLIADALKREEGPRAFELMHQELDKAWGELLRVLKPGGFACINIGDATRTLRGDFRLFSNHSRILESMCRLGFTSLPDILWRKQTNAPNKFLGSGMLPAGAYVTYEHEYVLIFRKGGKRKFSSDAEKLDRRQSAFFWEERNTWFSDLWLDLKGTTQSLKDPETRKRSAAFPFDLPYRLIQMYSLAGDTVLDPFLGTGTTTVAALASARHSVGLEVDAALRTLSSDSLAGARSVGVERTLGRLAAHREFVRARKESGGDLKHTHSHYDFPVVTRQEVDLRLYWPVRVHSVEPDVFEAEHSSDLPVREESEEAKPALTPDRSETPEPRRSSRRPARA